MIANKEPPDGKPKERKRAFEDQSGAPPPGPEESPCDWRRSRHGQRLTKVPVGIGPGAFCAWKPMSQQHQRGGKDAALRHAKQEPHHFKLANIDDQPATDRAQTPANQENTYHLAGAPVAGQVTTGDLEQQVAKKENADGIALDFVIHQEV